VVLRWAGIARLVFCLYCYFYTLRDFRYHRIKSNRFFILANDYQKHFHFLFMPF
jgi:hypothetical protein